MIDEQTVIELKNKLKTVCKVGEFTLTSGLKSNFYINVKELLLDAEFLGYVGDLIAHTISTNMDGEVTHVGGMELGSVPLSTATIIESRAWLSTTKNILSQFIIRKTPRTHGTCSQVEGWDNIKGKKVVLVDDVLTTGGSIKKMYEILKDHCEVVGIIIVVDRQDIDIITLENDLPPIYALFTRDELI